MAGERVLIVDDENSIRDLLASYCRREGYDVSKAANKKEALQLLGEGPFDVGIVDLRLATPGLAEGLEVVRQAKELYPDCEVIIITGYADVSSAIEAVRLGAYDYLQKPFPNMRLIALTVSRALERQRLARHNRQLLGDLKVAKEELERRRRQQLRSIRDLGRALAGALSARDVADVLAQAMLNSIDCDATGVLVLPRDGTQDPVAMIGAPRPLSAQRQDELICAILAHLPEHFRPDASAIKSFSLPTSSDEVDDEGFGRFDVGLLSVRGVPSGAAIVAKHEDVIFSEEDAGILGILVAQGGIALENGFLFARMRELATKDRLTGIFNHGHFFELLEAEISRAERYALELAVIMLDVDRNGGLKHINDTYGHQAGDTLLTSLACLLVESVRRADTVARYGGDEFIVLAPQTGRQSAYALAQRICDRVREMAFAVAPGQEQHVTVSVGVAVFHPGTNDDASSVVGLADQAAYLAKQRNGDQVCMIE